MVSRNTTLIASQSKNYKRPTLPRGEKQCHNDQSAQVAINNNRFAFSWTDKHSQLEGLSSNASEGSHFNKKLYNKIFKSRYNIHNTHMSDMTTSLFSNDILNGQEKDITINRTQQTTDSPLFLRKSHHSFQNHHQQEQVFPHFYAVILTEMITLASDENIQKKIRLMNRF